MIEYLIIIALIIVVIYQSQSKQPNDQIINQLKERYENETRLKIESIQKECENKIQRFVLEETERIKTESRKGQRNSIYGKVMEEIVEYLPDFKYNPKDSRMISNPIDRIIFHGLAEGRLEKIVFLEVKTGKYSRLNENEKAVRDCILAGKVEYDEIRLK